MYRKRQLLEKPKINMTPMIDVVFLLLTFFVLTFRIIIPEGDFNVRMSPEGQAAFVEVDDDSIQVRLTADAEGHLAAIRLNDEEIESFEVLRRRVLAIKEMKPDLEILLFFDDHLHYEYLIRTITALDHDNIKFLKERTVQLKDIILQ